jgi:hypothetical protein
MKTLICGQCGDECERTGQHQIYCKPCANMRKNKKSRTNADRYNIAKGKNVTGMILRCLICNAEFTARQGGNKYCSAECRRTKELADHHERTKSKVRAKVGDTISCIACGAEMVFKGGSHKRCEECRKLEAREKSIRWRINNPDRASEASKSHEAKRKNNPRRVAKVRVYTKRKTQKRTAEPGRNLHHRMSQLVRTGLKEQKGGKTWLSMVPYTVEQLMRHLERQFVDGMSWSNMGEWHIDHVIPRAFFNFSSPEDEDFKACWALSNLQPLWSADNIKKSNKRLFLI